MTTARYGRMFARLLSQQQGAFVPFCVLGDPNPDESLAIVQTLVNNGADAIELGIPFSDPIADGRAIAAADLRALRAHCKPSHAFSIIAEVRRQFPELPIGVLVYCNLVEARGREAFYAAAHRAGADSVLIADVPTLEAEPFTRAALAAGIDPVLIAAPNTSDADLASIAASTRGFTYVVSRSGVTGADREAGLDHRPLFARLAALGAPPALLGFGISRPEQVRAALCAGARGAISGSAIALVIEQHPDAASRRLALAELVRTLKAATVGWGAVT